MIPAEESSTMIKIKTPSETIALPENSATMMTVQRITVVISRRKKILAFEGVEAAGAASDIRKKIADQVARGQFECGSNRPEDSEKRSFRSHKVA